MANTYCVIMAGGIGSRFWPVSTARFPKQFHDILGTGETLLQQTFKRLLGITSAEKILVVTHKKYQPLVLEQLPDIEPKNIILEPARRNTAPCISYAAYRIFKEDPRANMLVAPSDHLISHEVEFIRICNIALEAAASKNYLLTMGIRPHRPDTGYGYIQYDSQQEKNLDPEVKQVKTFTEKPDEQLAQEFLDSGDFLWNSGIFIWNIETFRRELKEYQPEIFATFEDNLDKIGSAEEQKFIDTRYPQFDNESIDYGMMEKSEQVYVIPADFGWSDLGTWGSLADQLPKDKNQNAVVGNRLLTYQSRNNIVRIPDNKIAVLEGLEDAIVIDTPEALLICRKSQEQLIKSFVSDVKLEFGDETGI